MEVAKHSTVSIGDRTIGAGQACYVIAEAGSNHDGDLAQAMRLIDEAAGAGADAVKFQIFRADRLYPTTSGMIGRPDPRDSVYKIIADLEVPYDWLPQLAAHARERSIEFMASVFDERSTDQIDPFVRAFKIASFEVDHLPLIRHVAAKGKPVVISTGTADLAEVSETVRAFQQTGNRDLVLLQCTSSYPAPLETLNLRAIGTLAAAFGIPVGLSDHSVDPVLAAVVAVACGASVIEKHFTLQRSLPGPDHWFAIEPAELRLMVQRIRQAETALGRAEKFVTPIEQPLRAFGRRTIFARQAIAAGDPFTADNLVVLRCGRHEAGLAPDRLGDVIGRRAARAIAAEQVVRAEDVAS